MRISTIIVEERPTACGMLSCYLNEMVDETQLVGVAEGIDEGLRLAQKHKPDLVFLGETLSDGRRSQWNMPTIVLSKSWWPAEKLKKENFENQLLLPVSLDDLREAIERFRMDRERQRRSESGELRVVPNLLEAEQHVKVSIPVVKGFHLQRLREIVLMSSAGSYTDFLLKDGRRFQGSRSLKYFAEQLESWGFFRCHDSHAINLNELETYFKGRGGTVVMSSGDELPVSRYRREGLLKALTHPESFSSIPTEY